MLYRTIWDGLWPTFKLKAKKTNNAGAIKSQVQRLVNFATNQQKKKTSFAIRCWNHTYLYMYCKEDNTWNIQVIVG